MFIEESSVEGRGEGDGPHPRRDRAGNLTGNPELPAPGTRRLAAEQDFLAMPLAGSEGEVVVSLCRTVPSWAAMQPPDFSKTEAQVRAVQAGDTAALEDLFERYLPRVSRLVAARIGKSWREVALQEDLVQETFVDALTALRDGQIENEGAFLSWMARCVQHNIQDARKAGRTAKRGEGQVRRLADLNESFLGESLFADGDATPSQHAAARETEERLEEALLKIPSRYREVLGLRSYARMSYREIAETMGLPSENTANVLFLRARAELEKHL